MSANFDTIQVSDPFGPTCLYVEHPEKGSDSVVFETYVAVGYDEAEDVLVRVELTAEEAFRFSAALSLRAMQAKPRGGLCDGPVCNGRH